MAGPVVLRKRNRNFILDLKPNHSKFEELKNPFIKLKCLKSLSFLTSSRASAATAKYLRKTVSDSYLLNWKVKKKQLRKIEKQFVEIKMKFQEEELNYNATILKSENNDLNKIRQVDLESTLLTTFPMQFGNIFTMKNFSFPENSIFNNLGSLFSKNDLKAKSFECNFEKGVNTSSSKFCKENQTSDSKENTKTQNVRVKKKSKRIQTDPTQDENALSKRIEHKNKAANLNYKTINNEFIEELDEEKKRTGPKLKSKQRSVEQNHGNQQQIASKTHLNPSIFSFSRYNQFMDACGFDIFSNFIPKSDIYHSNCPKCCAQSNSTKFKPPKPSGTSLKVNTSKNTKKKSKEIIKRPRDPTMPDSNKSSLEKKKFQCNTATMDKLCSVESKKSIDLIALRNFILKFSPLNNQKPSLENKDSVSESIQVENETRNVPKKRSRSSKKNPKPQNRENKPPRKPKRKLKKRQSRDQNIGTDNDEITNLLPRKKKIDFDVKTDDGSLEPSPNPSLDFKPIIFNQNQAPTFAMSASNSRSMKHKKSDPFRSGLVRKTSKQQSKFVGRRGNIFDYVSCITSTSSTIYSSSESIRKIFARSKMSILTVESDYSSLLKMISKSNEQKIAMFNCEDLGKDSPAQVEQPHANIEEETVSEEVNVEEYKQEIIVACVQVEQCMGKLLRADVDLEKEKSRLTLEISDEEKVVEVLKHVESDDFYVEVEESRTHKYKKIGTKILKTISRLSHRKKATNILIPRSLAKLNKKKCREILKEHKISEESVALQKVSSCKMQKQYIFNIGQIEGVIASPVVINLRVDSVELSQKCSSKTNKLRSIFNCVASRTCPKDVVVEKKVQSKKYSDEIIAKEEQRSAIKLIKEELSSEDVPLPNKYSNLEFEDFMNRSLEDIRILFRSSFDSETEMSENELGDQNNKLPIEKKMSATDIKNSLKLIELKINPSNADGEKCFVNPISIYVDPNSEAIAADAKYKIDCLDTIVVESTDDAQCHRMDIKKPMKIQINLLLHQLQN